MFVVATGRYSLECLKKEGNKGEFYVLFLFSFYIPSFHSDVETNFLKIMIMTMMMIDARGSFDESSRVCASFPIDFILLSTFCCRVV